MDGVEEALGDAVFACGVCVEDDLAGLEAGEVDVEHLTEDGDGVEETPPPTTRSSPQALQAAAVLRT